MALLAGIAHGSTDLELVRPTFLGGSLPWMSSPLGDEAGGLRGGVLIQYERDPLVLHEFGREKGAVVRNRTVMCAGGSWQPREHLGFYATGPIAWHWGTETPGYTQDGFAPGDVAAGVQVRGLQARFLQSAFRLEVAAPTGNEATWSGDGTPRGAAEVLLSVGNPYTEFDLSVGLSARAGVPDAPKLDAGSDVHGALALVVRPWPGKLELSAGAVSRASLAQIVELREDRNGSLVLDSLTLAEQGPTDGTEMLFDVRVHPRPHLALDVGIGKGLTYGYGTTQIRGWVGLTWTRIPVEVLEPMPAFDELVAVVPLPDTPEDGTEPVEAPEWSEGVLVRLETDRIEVRDPIQFEFGTANILEESKPILDEMAGLLNDNGQLLHMVIEGHASEEGSHRYNYDLSYARARAIWEALVEAGVHPDRISTRGMGEVVPVSEGHEEEDLALNRRVEFRIVATQPEWEELPERSYELDLPWSGEAARLRREKKPDALKPEEPKDESLDPEFFDDDEDE